MLELKLCSGRQHSADRRPTCAGEPSTPDPPDTPPNRGRGAGGRPTGRPKGRLLAPSKTSWARATPASVTTTSDTEVLGANVFQAQTFHLKSVMTLKAPAARCGTLRTVSCASISFSRDAGPVRSDTKRWISFHNGSPRVLTPTASSTTFQFLTSFRSHRDHSSETIDCACLPASAESLEGSKSLLQPFRCSQM